MNRTRINALISVGSSSFAFVNIPTKARGFFAVTRPSATRPRPEEVKRRTQASCKGDLSSASSQDRRQLAGGKPARTVALPSALPDCWLRSSMA
jgi:hypothetical protein